MHFPVRQSLKYRSKSAVQSESLMISSNLIVLFFEIRGDCRVDFTRSQVTYCIRPFNCAWATGVSAVPVFGLLTISDIWSPRSLSEILEQK